MIDHASFNDLCSRLIGADRKRSGIGTLGEKTLHFVLKNYFQNDPSFHEVKVGKYYADILDENGITEIQTRSFNVMRKKLRAFLPDHRVRIVFPVARRKQIVWIDPDSGETTTPRKSPKTGVPADILPELYKIKEFLYDPALSFTVVLLDVTEYRLKNGWSADGKHGSEKYESIPDSIEYTLDINNAEDYAALLPPDLPDSFDSKTFSKIIKRSRNKSGIMLNVLTYIGAVERTSKVGNAFIYKIAERD
ncbi:MAG: hypothetical protein IJS94_06355 [Clostridia bacterium]|nr:hypothetical protein [Clostridia bacterium]